MQARGAVDDDELESSDSGDGSDPPDSDSETFGEASDSNDSDSDFDVSPSHKKKKGGTKLGVSSAGKKSKASKSAAKSKQRAGSSAASHSSSRGASAPSSKSQKQSTEKAAKTKNGSAGSAKKKRVPGSKPAAELPLTLSSRKPTGKATVLVSSEHPIDLEGEVGAVGCVTMAGETLVLDIAGHRYRARPVPVQSHCVLHVTDKEAKIESIANVCLQLDHLADVVQELGGSLGEAGAGIDAKALFASVEAEAGANAGGGGDAGKSGGRKGRASSTTASSSSSSSSSAAASGSSEAGPAVLGSQAVAAAQELEMIGRARSKGRSKKRKH